MDKLKPWLKLALVVVPAAYLINFAYAVSSDESGGTFGDTFGAANALFSGAALMMLIYAVILQRDELDLVKAERDDTRRILTGQEKLNALQKAAIETQIFEQSFFSLVQLIAEERRSLDNPFVPTAKASTIGIASSRARDFVDKERMLDEAEVDTYISQCGTYCRLLITAFATVEDRRFEAPEELKYASTLHALIDADVAYCWFLLSCRWAANDPRALTAFANLQGTNFLDEKHRSFAESKLEEIL